MKPSFLLIVDYTIFQTKTTNRKEGGFLVGKNLTLLGNRMSLYFEDFPPILRNFLKKS